jgi:hypothetical protein
MLATKTLLYTNAIFRERAKFAGLRDDKNPRDIVKEQLGAEE